MRDLLPDEVISEISGHLIDGCARGEQGRESANEEEDTITGDLGGCLRKQWTSVSTDSKGTWKWRMTYKKFQGRGRGASEKIIGADRIFEIEVENAEGLGETKGLLFQSKKINNTDHNKLIEQLGDMEELVPGGSALIEFGPNQFRAFESTIVLSRSGTQNKANGNGDNRLGNFLAKKFLLCKSGARGLYYEAPRNINNPKALEGVHLNQETVEAQV